ncbi:GRIM-19 [Phakopsora pachyrhizi]|uniref:NADH dehydrogenase [ubiquinone] 1 alpha subcomplex subunit 13 n=1 Tax=Phakopsora pachyrhizi TaxID=170000 RepID=A0AAV0AY59_PHAPC|nr:GRIM-19 [Phakopsora pachyrhizi]CAH7675371.1 GRIM-19 [Phakopsora pachyrhizi]
MSIPYKQDLPPTGGYAPIKFKRNLPVKGPSGAVLIGAVFGICTLGFYRYGQGNLEKLELKREQMWSRIHLVPLLMAESDRDAYRRNRANLEREKEIMRDVPGWEAGKSVYNTKKYVPTTIVPM